MAILFNLERFPLVSCSFTRTRSKDKSPQQDTGNKQYFKKHFIPPYTGACTHRFSEENMLCQRCFQVAHILFRKGWCRHLRVAFAYTWDSQTAMFVVTCKVLFSSACLEIFQFCLSLESVADHASTLQEIIISMGSDSRNVGSFSTGIFWKLPANERMLKENRFNISPLFFSKSPLNETKGWCRVTMGYYRLSLFALCKPYILTLVKFS